MYRALGNYERLSYQIDKVIPHTCATVAIIKGHLPDDVLRISLDRLQNIQPILNVRIKKKKEDLVFYNPKEITIPLYIIVSQDRNLWVKEAEKAISTSLNDDIFLNHALARVIYIRSYDSNEGEIVFAYNHAIGDGISSAYIFETLLEIASGIKKNINTASHYKNKYLPPLEELLSNHYNDKPDKLTHNDSCISNSVQLHTEHEKTILYNDLIEKKRCTGIISRTVDKENFEYLLKISKDNKIKMNSLITAISLLCIYFNYKPSNQAKVLKLEITVTCPVNMRPFLNTLVNNDEFAYLVSWIDSQYKIDKNLNFWDLVKKINVTIHKDIEQQHPIKRMLDLNKITSEFINPWQLIQSVQISQPHLCLSNLGKLNLNNRFGDIQLTRLHLALNCHIFCTTENSFLLFASAFNDELTFDFCYPKPTFTLKRANLIADTLTNIINNLCYMTGDNLTLENIEKNLANIDI